VELAVPAVLAIHLALPHLKAIMAELDTAEGSLTTVAEVAAQVLLVKVIPLLQKVETEQLRQSLAVALLMLVVAEVVLILHTTHQVEPGEQAAAEMVVAALSVQMELPIQVAVEAEAESRPELLMQAALAAPVSSSSNTTSALPQSSPLSHRRSGLHQRVR
jgi:hypothetical protein